MASPLIYMNNAASSWPKPQSVLDAVQESLKLPVFGSGRTTGSQGIDYVSLAREKVASFFHLDNPESIIFTYNATDSLNRIISGFVKKNIGCHVVATKLDHNSVLRSLHEYAAEGTITLSLADFDKDGQVSFHEIEKCLKPETKMVVMSHASNVIGSVQAVKEIGTKLAKEGIFFVVDGAQTAGHIPINLKNMGCGAFVFTGHKGLLGIPGVGGFYLSNPEVVAPTFFGGTGSQSRELLQPRQMPERFEAGTHNHVGLASLAAGIDYIEDIGISAIQKKSEYQIAYLVHEMEKESNIVIQNKSPGVPVLSFNISHLSNDDVGFILARKYGIITRTGLHCAPLVHESLDNSEGSVRISLSCMTTDEECQLTAKAIRGVASSAAARIHSA